MTYIGIAMTTRNRSRTLGICLRHFAEFPCQYDHRRVLIDDNSNDQHRLTNEALARQFGWEYQRLEERRGVARAKNTALNKIRDCEWIFLLEDDCWPIAKKWEDMLIETAIFNGCDALNAAHPNGMSDAYIVGTSGAWNHPLLEVANSTGYLMVWKREALEKLGGYDARMGICGGEDTQMNLRCHAAGFKKHPYCGPARIGEFFYSVDLDWIWGKIKKKPPLGDINVCEGSCLTGAEKESGWGAGAKYVHDLEIYKEPLE